MAGKGVFPGVLFCCFKTPPKPQTQSVRWEESHASGWKGQVWGAGVWKSELSAWDVFLNDFIKVFSWFFSKHLFCQQRSLDWLLLIACCFYLDHFEIAFCWAAFVDPDESAAGQAPAQELKAKYSEQMRLDLFSSRSVSSWRSCVARGVQSFFCLIKGPFWGYFFFNLWCVFFFFLNCLTFGGFFIVLVWFCFPFFLAFFLVSLEKPKWPNIFFGMFTLTIYDRYYDFFVLGSWLRQILGIQEDFGDRATMKSVSPLSMTKGNLPGFGVGILRLIASTASGAAWLQAEPEVRNSASLITNILWHGGLEKLWK